MLSVYRRHREQCPHADDRVSKRCRCILWVSGTVEGKPVRESLKTRNWDRAEQLKRERESNLAPEQKASKITLQYAIQKYYEASEARRLAANTLRKYRTVKKVISDFAEKHAITLLTSFTQQNVRDLLAERKLGAVSTAKEIERIRTFFTFCLDNDWIKKNPARPVKPPKTKQIPRLPFSDDQISNILSKAEDDQELAFLSVLRHTGLRIGDASLLRTSQLSGNRIHLYTTKAGIPAPS